MPERHAHCSLYVYHYFSLCLSKVKRACLTLLLDLYPRFSRLPRLISCLQSAELKCSAPADDNSARRRSRTSCLLCSLPCSLGTIMIRLPCRRDLEMAQDDPCLCDPEECHSNKLEPELIWTSLLEAYGPGHSSFRRSAVGSRLFVLEFSRPSHSIQQARRSTRKPHCPTSPADRFSM